MWARIENGAVAEITDIDPTGRFHPALKWRVCGEDVAPGWIYDGQTYEAPARAQPRADILCARIDDAADAARARVAGDPLRAVEYDRAWRDAQAFADAGYPGDAVPRTVAAWAINGRTAQRAADSILAEAAAYTEALYVIRETRLAAKEHIRMLMDAGEVEQAQQLAEQTIAVIEGAVAGVGNNPAA
jgi:hypothetical protein